MVREPGNEHDRFTAVFEDESFTPRFATGQLSIGVCYHIMHRISNVASQFMLSELLFLRYIAQIIIL